MIELGRVTRDSFRPYGSVLIWDSADGKRLQMATDERGGVPWMTATFRVDAHEVTYLAEHPESIELFVPLSGVSVLVVARPETPESYQAFLLDVPVVIDRGIWHGMCALSDHAILGIVENTEAGGSRRYLELPLKVGLG